MAHDRARRTLSTQRATARTRGVGAVVRSASGISQRERLNDAVIAVTAREGYAGATAGLVIETAGVSRRTFYEYFADKEACFLSALTDAHEQLLAGIRLAVIGEPQQALGRAIDSLVAFARSEPVTARALLSESMAAGPVALDLRDRAIDQIAHLVEHTYASLDPATPVPDVAVRLLIGGVWRQLAARLRHTDQALDDAGDGLIEWIGTYERPLSTHRWRGLRPIPLPSPAAAASTLHPSGAHPPEPLSNSREEIAAYSRARILAAVACLAEQRGYAATTIADIAKRAGLSPRAFYRSFADKQEAFAALHEHHFRTLMGVTAGAFFAQDHWPTRIWEAGRAFTRYLELNLTVARTSFIESYAGHPVSLQRVEELVGAFTLFLREGYDYPKLAAPPPKLALDAIATTIFELNYLSTRAGRVHELGALIPHATFITLAPFLGAPRTNSFIDIQLGSARPYARPRLTQSARS